MIATNSKLVREKNTIRDMIALYCAGLHGDRPGLCPDCGALQAYAIARLDHCPFGEDKTTCANCPVHCYKPDMRERVRQVMRYAGPRMARKHPWRAFLHFLHGFQKAKPVTRPSPRP